VEFPVQTIPSGSRKELFQLILNDITPIITHPERNLVFQNNINTLYDLVNMGCLVQITAMSVTGEMGEDAMECAHRLLELRLAHVIASDAHSSDNRPPILSEGVAAAAEVLGSSEEARAMVDERPRAIIAGRDVDVPEPKQPQKKRWWTRWLGI
jgi:protein-tyrosine phosphatase